jgi:pimeloyl-ACP methyl ester carboxylesterase
VKYTRVRAGSLCATLLTLAIGGAAAQAPASYAGLQEGFAPGANARLHYLDSGGNGVPVVFLHAGTGSSQVWEYQVPAFTRAGYRFITYDRRGYGKTTVDASQSGQSATADVLSLLDHLKLDRIHAVGTAAGGGIALEFALAHPQRLRSVVLANTVGGGVQDADYQELGRRMRPQGFQAMPPDFRELGPTYRAGNPEGTKRWLELEERSRAPQPTAAPAQGRGRGAAAADSEPSARYTFQTLETIRVPFLLLTGGADLYAPPPVLQLFAAHLKGSETVVIPEVGHSAYWENPDRFNQAVLAFLRKH